MDNSNPSSDEPVLLTAHKIIIGGVRHEAGLTGKRLLLSEEDSRKVVEDIPFTALVTITAGENSLREPTVTLSFTGLAGENRSLELIFARQAGGLNVQERDKMLALLRDHSVTVTGAHTTEAAQDTIAPQTAQNWMPSPYNNKVRQPAPELPGRERSPFITIGAIVIIIAVIVGIAFFYQPFGKGGTPGTHPAVPTVPKTPGIPATIATPPAATTSITTVPTQEPFVTPVIVIPMTGVWVRVTYAGNYSGYVSAQGITTPLTGTGDQIYYIPVRGGTMDGSIEKQDFSSGKMEIGVYQNGVLYSLLNTTKPEGLIDFHLTLPASTAIAGTVFTPTPAPTPQAIFLPQKPIPPTGVWVRVYYPGNFTGSLGYLGFQNPVNSSGDQFYQIPIRSGNVIGSIEKEDGSANDLVVAIYKDGGLAKELDTRVPKGIIYLHEPV
jgi:hypothetical protein